jgi:pyruvate/2-oxoglutarate dehydrogenase complex dihydrolipoamide acyltransferase (E2) component
VLARIAGADASSPARGVRSPARGVRSPARGGYTPVVMRMAERHGVDLSQVAGTGRDGRVRKRDVLAYLEAGGGEPEAQDGGQLVAPLSRMRRSIAEHMKRSLETAATCTTWIEVDMTKVEQARAALGLTALPIVSHAAIRALATHPALNAWLDGETRTLHSDVNLGIAVALGDEGLIVPVVQRAQELSVEGLAARVKELAGRARAGELAPDDVRGGTFTISNPGQFGSLATTPIINQPQVAILDLEAITKRPVVAEVDGADAIVIRPTTIVGLSWDHRALDGALAAKFLATLRWNLEHWPEARPPAD